MAFVGGSQDKKNLNVELNLMPVFDVLAVCICFLLMTVVWIQVGMIKTSQSMGGQSQSETKTSPSVWVTIDEKSNVEFSFKNLNQQNLNEQARQFAKKSEVSFKSQGGQISTERINNFVQGLKNSGIETVLVVPAANTSYNTIIEIMDSFKSAGLLNIGITPL